MKPRAWDDHRRLQAKRLGANIVKLGDLELDPAMAEVRRRMVEQFGAKVGDLPGSVPMDDFLRMSLVLGKIGGGSLLDVGLAHGVAVNAAVLSGRFDRVVGIDIDDYPLFSQMGDFELLRCDVTEMRFADREFDTVTAMEIIEHLPDGKFEAGIDQLRRVADRRIITVPFCEGPRLYRGHFRSFDPALLRRLFPDAEFTVLVKRGRGTPWVMIEESR